MMPDRKQSLRALVRSRGFVAHHMRQNLVSGQYVATAYVHEWPDITVRARRKYAALAGLRAVLESMPERKVKR